MPTELGPAMTAVAATLAQVLGNAIAAVVRAELVPVVAGLDRLTAAVAASQPEAPQWLSLREAAQLLGVSSQTARNMCSRHEVESRRCGRRILVLASSLAPVDRELVATAARAARGAA